MSILRKILISLIMLSGTIVYGAQVSAYNSGKYNGYIHEGGSRSSKTTSIIQFLLTWAERQTTAKRFIIAREKNTWTRATVLYDFVQVMKDYNYSDEQKKENNIVYENSLHNKTDAIIKYWDVEFWFGGLDDPQRIHGFTSDGFWLNEANEAAKDDFDQLGMRCSGFFILDYNPNMPEDHWILNLLLRKDVKYIHSTVIDNPFAPEQVVRKINSYNPDVPENIANKTADKNKWEIYGLGVRAVIEGLIYDKWDVVDTIPAWVQGHKFTWLDFGYTNDVTSIGDVYIWKETNEAWIDEYCYETGLTNPDIARRIKQNQGRKVWADSSEPKSIQEIFNAGVNIHGVMKGPDSIKNGIDVVKRFTLHVTTRSVNTITELRNYKYMQDKNGKWLNEPIDDYNHSMDGIRYVLMSECPMKVKGRSPNDLAKIFH